MYQQLTTFIIQNKTILTFVDNELIYYKERSIYINTKRNILTKLYAFNCANIRSISSSASAFFSLPPIAPDAVGASLI